MRNAKKTGGFFLCLLLNLLINLEWTIPGFVFMGLFIWLGHQVFMWLMIAAFSIYVISVLAWTVMMSLANKAGNSQDAPRENKNPYSSKGYEPTNKK